MWAEHVYRVRVRQAQECALAYIWEYVREYMWEHEREYVILPAGGRGFPAS